MRIQPHLPLAALFGSLAAITQPPMLQAQKIHFQNVRDVGVELCVFNGADKIQMIPLKCWDMTEKGDWFGWDPGKDNSTFHVGLFDLRTRQALCHRQNIPRDIYGIEFGMPCQIAVLATKPEPVRVPTPAPKPPLESVLTVCNQSIGEKVNFAIAYVVDVSVGGGATHVLAEGWWELEKGECKAIPWSDRMKKWRNPGLPADLTINPHFFIYAETEGLFGGAIKRVMEGDESDPDDISVCINSAKNFEYRQQPTNSPRFGMAAEKKCADKRIRMANVPRHNEDLTEFRWTF